MFKNQNRPRPAGFQNPVHVIEIVDASLVPTVRSHTPSIHKYEMVILPPNEPDGGFHHEASDQGNTENKKIIDDNDLMKVLH